MKISNSKKELARIISENGGWRDGGYFAVQDNRGSSKNLWFSSFKPTRDIGSDGWRVHGGGVGECLPCSKLISNWHQTILSREEYFHLYPAPDDDGWIEWKGGECPVDKGVLVDVKFLDGTIQIACEAMRENKPPHHKYWTYDWLHCGERHDIISYRLHNPEQAKPEFCESVTRSIPEPKPTIEQLAADYRNRKDHADRKQQEADAAKADAEAKLAELVAAGKAIGLMVSVAATEPELVITDWLDLREGDEVECVEPAGGDVVAGSVGTIVKINKFSAELDFPEQKCYGYCKSHFDRGAVKFIRRP